MLCASPSILGHKRVFAPARLLSAAAELTTDHYLLFPVIVRRHSFVFFEYTVKMGNMAITYPIGNI